MRFNVLVDAWFTVVQGSPPTRLFVCFHILMPETIIVALSKELVANPPQQMFIRGPLPASCPVLEIAEAASMRIKPDEKMIGFKVLAPVLHLLPGGALWQLRNQCLQMSQRLLRHGRTFQRGQGLVQVGTLFLPGFDHVARRRGFSQ